MHLSSSTVNYKVNQLKNVCYYYRTRSKGTKPNLVLVASFDRHGLLTEQILFEKSDELDWLKLMSQTLSLKNLMESFFKLEGFTRVTLRGEDIKAIAIRKKDGYRAIVFRP